jgi:nitroimidazol reductase NimA-like FMN-containing flavoprotein (pyridoxamine 5'-phosphate oxidase superfamily)
MAQLRRTDRRIDDAAEMKDIVERADACRLAFADNGMPYIVTMSFGYTWDDRLVLYFHGAKAGRKIDLLKKNSPVCFEMDIDHEIYKDEEPCRWGVKFRSLVGYGRLDIVADPAERVRGLELVMRHYGFPGHPQFNEKVLSVTEVLRLDATEVSGKKRV